MAHGNNHFYLGFDMKGGAAERMQGNHTAAPEQGCDVVDGIRPPSLSTECPQDGGDHGGSHGQEIHQETAAPILLPHGPLGPRDDAVPSFFCGAGEIQLSHEAVRMSFHAHHGVWGLHGRQKDG